METQNKTIIKNKTNEIIICKGWNKSLHPDRENLIKCGKKITLKNSTEESRGIDMCDKCFNALCKYNEKNSN